MADCLIFRNLNDDAQDNLNKFWTSFTTWINKSAIVNEYFKGEFVSSDCNIYNEVIYYLDINYEEEYKMFYGESYPYFKISNQGVDIDIIKNYLEIMYDRWIQSDKHYQFTIEVNKLFDKFHLPYKLGSGKVVGKGYKTTESVDKILNQRMFERKIAYSEEMIMSNELLDKKCALDYVVDALQYYISIQDADNIERKYREAALSVNNDLNTKVYSVIKSDISEIMKLANEYFDIRHNEYLNKAKEKREALDDLQFIEYLYNRAYALLYILRIKSRNAKLLIKEDEK